MSKKIAKKLSIIITWLILFAIVGFAGSLNVPQAEATIPSITVTSPNGGEEWVEGNTYDIEWNCPNEAGVDMVDIFIRDNRTNSGSSTPIVSLVECSLEKYSWKVENISSGENCFKVELRHVAGSQPLIDESDNYFSIVSETACSALQDQTSCLDNSNCYWDQQYDNCRTYDSSKQTCSDPDNGKDIYTQAHTYGFRESYADERDKRIRTGGKDACIEDKLREHYCANDYYIRTYEVKCPNGCEDGACIKGDEHSCLPDGTLIKLPNDPKIYVIINCEKKWIKTLDEFNQGGYKWGDVKETNSAVINAYAEYLGETANLLRAIGHHKVYRFVNGKRLWIPTIAAFNAQGLKWDDIQDVQETEVTQYPRIKLAKLANKPEVYYLTENGLKRHIPSPEVFNSYGNKWENVVEISSSELNAYLDSVLIKAENDYKIYKLENNKKRWIKTARAFNRLGYDWDEVSSVNDVEIDSYTSGTSIE